MEDKRFLELHNRVMSYGKGIVPTAKPIENDADTFALDDKIQQPNNEIQQLDNKNQQNNADFDTDKTFEGALDTSDNNVGRIDIVEPEIQELPNQSIWNDLDNSDFVKAVRRTNTYKTYMYSNEDTIKEARRMSQVLKNEGVNISEDLILSSPETLNNVRDVYKTFEKEMDIDKVFESYPELKTLAEKDHVSAALVLSNMKDVRTAHGIIENAIAGHNQYYVPAKQNAIGTKLFYGEKMSPEDAAKMKEIGNEIKNLKQIPDFFDAPLDNTVGTTTQQASMMIYQMAHGSPFAAAGAMIGYGGTKLLGRAAGTMVGGFAGGALGGAATEALAKQNAMRLMGIGARVGGAKAMFDELAGQYYLEALSYKNKAGGQQFTEEQARYMAGIQATVETLIEVGETEQVLKILGKNPATASVHKTVKDIITNAKNSASAMEQLKELAKNVYRVAKVESPEEGIQQVATDLVGNYFATRVAPDGDDQYGLKAYSIGEMATRAGEATLQAVVPSVGMGVLGSGASSIGVARNFMNSMKLNDVLSEVKVDFNNYKLNQSGVNMLKELKENFANSKLCQEHPEEAVQLLKESLSGSGFEEVTLDTELVKKEKGGQDVLFQMAIDAGMTEEQAQTAIDNNENITVPTEIYAKNIMANPLSENLLNKISFDKEGDCLERSRKFAASLKRSWDKMIDAEYERKMEAAYNVLKDDLGEDVAMDAMGVIQYYPDDPSAGARKMAKELQGQIDAEINPILKMMNDGIRQGVEDYWFDKETGEEVDVSDMFGSEETASSGSFGHARVSNNAGWYREFFRRNHRAPTKTEMRDIAIDVYSGKDDYGVLAEAGPMSNEDYEGFVQQGRRLANMIEDAGMYNKLADKLKDYDAGKVAAAEGLTEDGYAAYKYIVDSVKGLETNKATQKSVAVGAMLWAHVAERFAEAEQAMGKDTTALDVIKRFRFSDKPVGSGLNQQQTEIQSQMQAVREKYEGTAEWMKAPDGTDTQLTEEQWLYAHTDAFKEKYGDWETLSQNTFSGEIVNSDLVKKRIEEIRNEKFINDKTGDVATFSKDGRGKIISGVAVRLSKENGYSANDHFTAVYNTPQLFKTAVLSEKREDYNGQMNGMNLYSSFCIVNKKPAVAIFTVKVTNNAGKKLYTLQLVELKNPAGNLPEDEKTRLPASAGLSDEIISQSDTESNSNVGENRGVPDNVYKRSSHKEGFEKVNTKELADKYKDIHTKVNEHGEPDFSKLDVDDSVYYQFIGESGAARLDAAEELTTRIDNLNVAREMEKARKNAKAIKLATGWERGKDGKWRYEIDDSEILLSLNGDIPFLDNPKYQKMQEVDAKIMGLIMEGEKPNQELLDESKRLHEIFGHDTNELYDKINNEKDFTLSDILKHDELFKAYPRLRNLKVAIFDLGGEFNGWYSGRMIAIDKSLKVNKERLKSTLLHEIQHAIQNQEGFARGTIPENAKQNIREELAQFEDYAGSPLRQYTVAEINLSVIDYYKDRIRFRNNPKEFTNTSMYLATKPFVMPKDKNDYNEKLNELISQWEKNGLEEIKGYYFGISDWIDFSVENAIYEYESMSLKELEEAETAETDVADANRSQAERMENAEDILNKIDMLSDSEVYNRFAGEVESRNVQTRMNMSMEERLNSLASETEDVAREDQYALNNLLGISGNKKGKKNKPSIRPGDLKLKNDNDGWNNLVDIVEEKGIKTWENDVSGSEIKLMDIPLVLQMLGVHEGVLKIRSNFFGHSLRKEHPGMTFKELKDLPNEIANPVMVFWNKAEEKFLFVTENKTAKDARVVLPIEIDAKGRRGLVDLLNDAYAKTKGYFNKNHVYVSTEEPNNKWFAQILDNENPNYDVLYINKEKSKSLMEAARSNSPAGPFDNALLKFMLSERAKNVKTEIDLQEAKDDNTTFYQSASEEKTLAAYHNTNAVSLQQALASGGLAVPSIAITDKDIPFDNFGSITLVGNADLINPANGTDVYSRDAYTTRMPKPEYKAATTKLVNAWLKKHLDAFRKLGASETEVRRIITVAYNYPEEFQRELERSPEFLAYYLSEIKGKKLDLPKQSPEYQNEFLSDQSVTKEIEDIFEQDMSDDERAKILVKPVEKVLAKRIAEQEKAIKDNEAAVERALAVGKNVRASLFRERVEKKKRELEYLKSSQEEYFDIGKDNEKRVSAQEIRDMKRAIASVADIKKNAPIDWRWARSYLYDNYQTDLQGYDAFVEQTMKELMGEPRLKIGSKYVPYTLENVVEAMMKKRGAGQEAFMMTTSKLAGVGAKKFNSIEEIRKDKGNLRTKEQMDAIIQELDQYHNSVVKELVDNHGFDEWGLNDELNEALAEVIKGGNKATPAKVKRALAKHNIDGLSDEELNKVVKVANNYREAATWYFEAKPQRAVGVNEFSGAVVPEGTDENLIKQLQDLGLQVETYGLNRTRQEAVRAVQESRDTLFQRINQQMSAVQGAMETVAKGQYVIHIMETADESTFMHEMSHGFFDMMADMAGMEGAPEQVVKDYETLRKWCEWNPEAINEYKGTAVAREFEELDRLIREAQEKGYAVTKDAYGDEVKVPYKKLLRQWSQERFARGFEDYLKAGKAPSEGMRGIFSKFKNWLVRIYKGCVGVGAKPTDAVREVMDRMIATQEEIDYAIKKAELNKWRESGADEMLTKSSKEFYDNLLTKAREEAEEKVLKLALKDLDQEAKAKIEADIEAYRKDATEHVSQEPVFIVQKYLEQNPDLDPATVAQTLGNMSLKTYTETLKERGGSVKAAVDKMVDEYAKNLRQDVHGEKYRAWLKGEAEKAIGTSKYTDLIAAYELQAYKKAVKRLRNLESRLAKIEAKDEAERKEAEAIIRREEKAKAEQEDRDERVRELRAELRDLKQNVKVYGKNSQDEIGQARYYAANRLDTLPVGEATDFRKWGNLAVRKHQDAMDMLNSGNLEEATKLQKDVLVYRMLEKRAYELKEKYDKKVARLVARKKTIETSKNLAANDRYLYMHLLYLFGLTEKDVPRPENFPGVENMLLGNLDGTDDPNVPVSAIVNPEEWLKSFITNPDSLPMENGLNSLTMEQYREVEELMDYVYNAGMDRNSIKTLVDDDGTESTIDEVNAAILGDLINSRDEKDIMHTAGADSKLERAMRGARKYWVELIKPETILNAMGENAMKYLYNPLRKCADKELQMNKDAIEKQKAIFAQYRDDVIEHLGKEEGEALLKGFSTEKLYGLNGDRIRRSELTHEELICLALNLGTEIGHKRVLDGYGISEGALRNLLYNLTSADWTLIQSIWDMHEEYWPELRRVTAAVTGVTMEKQEPREFTVMSKDGVAYPIRGGYYHLAYDRTKNLKVRERDADKRLDTQSNSNRRFGIGVGMTKERNEYEVKYLLDLHLSVMQRAVAETIHYISFYETVRDVNRLVNSEMFAETTVGFFGEEQYETLQKWVKDAWALEPESKTEVERFNAAMRSNQTMATLGFSMITALENALNIFPMMAEIGPKNTLEAVFGYYGNMFRRGVTDPREMFAQNQFIADHSIFMAERGESIDPNVYKNQEANGINEPNIAVKPFNKLTDVAFLFITQTDLMLARPLWMHEYQRVYNECIAKQLDPDVAERKAVQAGDAAVRHVFGSSAEIDRAEIQKSRSEIVKFMTMFYSYFSTVHNAMLAKGYEYDKLRHEGKGILQAASPTLVWGVMMWYILPSIGSAVMRAYLKGDDDDREPEKLAAKIASTFASNVAGGLPFARDAVPALLDLVMGEKVYGFRNVPLYEAAQQTMRTVSAIKGVLDNKKDEVDVMRAMARLSVYMTRFPLTLSNAMITAAQWISEGDLTEEDLAKYLQAMVMNMKPKK